MARSKTIKLKAGDKKIIRLPEKKGTGYQWEWSFDKEQVAQVKPENSVDVDRGDVVGGEGEVTFTVHALKKGKATLVFELKRPWEAKEVKEETQSFVIVVR